MISNPVVNKKLTVELNRDNKWTTSIYTGKADQNKPDNQSWEQVSGNQNQIRQIKYSWANLLSA